MLAAAAGMLFLSARFPALLTAGGIGAAVLLLPALLSLVGAAWLSVVSWAVALAGLESGPGLEGAAVAVGVDCVRRDFAVGLPLGVEEVSGMKLTIRNLNKSYGKTRALMDFSYEFTPGIYGILGANGAGKSTLFGMLTDTLRRQSGEILWNDTDILKLGRAFRAKLGYMPQAQGYYPQMSAREFLCYMGEIKGLPRKKLQQEADRLLSAVDLKEVAHRKLGQFSGGMRQRALLAQAMLGSPELLILDEPTAGVDPRERIRIRSFIADLARDRIVLLATHVVTDVECIADRVLLMNKGKLVRRPPENLIASIQSKAAEKLCTPEEIECPTSSSTASARCSSGRRVRCSASSATSCPPSSPRWSPA